jgi:hypothetical protein
VTGPIALARADGLWQTGSMETSLKYPPCHEDLKAQELLDRVKKRQAKNIPQNSPATSSKECLTAAWNQAATIFDQCYRVSPCVNSPL